MIEPLGSTLKAFPGRAGGWSGCAGKRRSHETAAHVNYHVPISRLTSARVQTRYLGRPLLTAGRASASE
jgi:hypothetical protein